MTKLSALGDTALLAPVSLVLLLYLCVLRRCALAGALALALAAGGTVTLASKLLFNTCGASLSGADVISPSGHASFATMIYGSLAIMVGAGRPLWQRIVIAAATLALVGGIGVSRVVLGWHSEEEVVFGLLVGALAVALFALLRTRLDVSPLSPVPLAIGLAVMVLLLGGREFTPEQRIVWLSRILSEQFDICTDGPARQAGLKAVRRYR